MPLVVLCGLPGSGRSRRAEELRRALCAEGRAVHVVGDAEDAAGVYGDSGREKASRGSLRASVERLLSRRDVVIVDSVNYIKGFRYELYCLARAARTPLCLVYCVRPGCPGAPGSGAETPGPCSVQDPVAGAGTPDDPSAEPQPTRAADSPPPGTVSAKHQADAIFPPELLEALAQRFEAPDSRNRWDRPLFTVVGLEEPLPLAEIKAALFENRAPPPHQSTQPQPLASGSFLHQLDLITTQVLTALMEAQKGAIPGDLLTLPGTTEHLRFTRPLSLAELSRLRRQFISYSKMHPSNENLPQLANMFLQYLSQNVH